jgi:hypothetical protein
MDATGSPPRQDVFLWVTVFVVDKYDKQGYPRIMNTTTATKTTDAMTELFGETIYSYTRAQALDDGQQVDANIGDLGDVTPQHFRMPVYMTAGVFAIMETAVNNPRYSYQDYKGIWHDVCTMAGLAIRASRNGSEVAFRVIIKGAGRKSLYTMVAQCGPVDIDDARSCITIMLPEDR